MHVFLEVRFKCYYFYPVIGRAWDCKRILGRKERNSIRQKRESVGSLKYDPPLCRWGLSLVFPLGLVFFLSPSYGKLLFTKHEWKKSGPVYSSEKINYYSLFFFYFQSYSIKYRN